MQDFSSQTRDGIHAPGSASTESQPLDHLASSNFPLLLALHSYGMCLCVLSHVRLFVTPWTVAHQAPLSMGFPRQEYWSGLLFQGIFLTQDWTQVSCVSCFGRQILYHFITYWTFRSQLANQHWYLLSIWASLVPQMVKNLPAMLETWVRPLGWEDPLKKELAIHSSILVWRIPMDRGAWRAIVCGVEESDWASNTHVVYSAPFSPKSLFIPGSRPGHRVTLSRRVSSGPSWLWQFLRPSLWTDPKSPLIISHYFPDLGFWLKNSFCLS